MKLGEYANPERAACHLRVKQAAVSHFPAPVVKTFRLGGSGGRRSTSHKVRVSPEENKKGATASRSSLLYTTHAYTLLRVWQAKVGYETALGTDKPCPPWRLLLFL